MNLQPKIFINRILSDVDFDELNIRQKKQIENFLVDIGFEEIAIPRTKLSTVYKLWLIEKRRRKKTKKMRDAERVLAAKTLAFEEMLRKKKYGEKKEKKRAKWELLPSERVYRFLEILRKNLKKLGITKERDIESILDRLKDVMGFKREIEAITKLDERVERILVMFSKEIGYLKEKLSKKPLLLALPDAEFEKFIEKTKKEIERIVKFEKKKIQSEELRK